MAPATAINWPDWQKPHCGTWFAIQASWAGWLEFGDRPSTVTIFCPTTDAAVVMQELIGTLLASTVQHPQICIPQPYFVPVRPIRSLSTHKSGIAGSFTVTA